VTVNRAATNTSFSSAELYLARPNLIHFGRAKLLLSHNRNSAQRELRLPLSKVSR